MGKGCGTQDPAVRGCACPNVLTWTGRALWRVRSTASKDVSMERLTGEMARL